MYQFVIVDCCVWPLIIDRCGRPGKQIGIAEPVGSVTTSALDGVAVYGGRSGSADWMVDRSQFIGI